MVLVTPRNSGRGLPAGCCGTASNGSRAIDWCRCSMPHRPAAASTAGSASATPGASTRLVGLSRRAPARRRGRRQRASRYVRSIPADWPRIIAYDAAIFGADRGALLRRLAGRLPQAALIAERHGRLAGFPPRARWPGHEPARAAGRPKRSSRPRAPARTFHAVAFPLAVDVPDRHAGLGEWLRTLGFAAERPLHEWFTARVRRSTIPALVRHRRPGAARPTINRRVSENYRLPAGKPGAVDLRARRSIPHSAARSTRRQIGWIFKEIAPEPCARHCFFGAAQMSPDCHKCGLFSRRPRGTEGAVGRKAARLSSIFFGSAGRPALKLHACRPSFG